MIKFLIWALCGVFLFLAAGCGSQTTPDKRGSLAETFETMLEDSMVDADLVAHVEITGFEQEERSGDMVLYRVAAKMLESFKGPSPRTLVFRQWITEQADEEAIGERVIVALHESAVDGSYFVLEGDSAFPDHENLLDSARNAETR
ncbi:hypothetical protein [Pelagibius sp. Alg239-R121]|uniref:hypothetical protein n=1 Tax=Pelagibius sp. Alg239-R121 TaxID=2993448 RepID=UPI0024A6A5F3|nr:hypothetical protein [Pelagibius sp. Alg239-R121]